MARTTEGSAILNSRFPFCTKRKDHNTRACQQSGDAGRTRPLILGRRFGGGGLGAKDSAGSVVPPLPCDANKFEFGLLGFILLGRVALDENLVSNMFYVGRMPRNQWQYHCERFMRRYQKGKLVAEAAYVMPPEFFWPQRDRLIVHRYCEIADDVVLCRRVQTRTG